MCGKRCGNRCEKRQKPQKIGPSSSLHNRLGELGQLIDGASVNPECG
jgi:hypothetical protein